MKASVFAQSLADSAPPASVSAALAALWWARRGDWEKAHRMVMDEPGAEAAWVHAYLHRVEGDLGNARYWYRQAGKTVATGDLDKEWSAIAATLLD